MDIIQPESVPGNDQPVLAVTSMDIAALELAPGNDQPVLAVTPEAVSPWSKKMITLYTLANFGLAIALDTPAVTSLSLRIAMVDPVGKATSLGLIIGAGSFAHLLVGPIMGAISDRTTSRFGRRRPWIILGAIGGFLSLLVIALSSTIPLILLGWCLAQITFNILSVGFSAILPDQVPNEQLGKVTGYARMMPFIATVTGIVIASLLITKSIFLVFMIPAAIGLLTCLALAFVMSDRRLRKEEIDPFHLGEFLKGFWISPRRFPDYGWAFLALFLSSLGTSIPGAYGGYLLIDRFHYTIAQVPTIQLIIVGIGVFFIPLALVAGWLSDRLRRRKVFVISSFALSGACGLFIAVASSVVMYIAAFLISSIGTVVNITVMAVLTIEVLPRKEAAGKDLGVFTLATLLPASIGPTIAPLIMHIGGNNYTLLFLVSGAFGLAAALAIIPIKGVR